LGVKGAENLPFMHADEEQKKKYITLALHHNYEILNCGFILFTRY
jgi:hypothetical protein